MIGEVEPRDDAAISVEDLHQLQKEGPFDDGFEGPEQNCPANAQWMKLVY